MKSSFSFLTFSLPVLLCLNNINVKANNPAQSPSGYDSIVKANRMAQPVPSSSRSSAHSCLKKIYDLFTAHPHAHQMTYWTHFGRALRFSLKMGYGSFCLILHALFPFLFETVGSDTVKELYEEIMSQSKKEDMAKNMIK